MLHLHHLGLKPRQFQNFKMSQPSAIWLLSEQEQLWELEIPDLLGHLSPRRSHRAGSPEVVVQRGTSYEWHTLGYQPHHWCADTLSAWTQTLWCQWFGSHPYLNHRNLQKLRSLSYPALWHCGSSLSSPPVGGEVMSSATGEQSAGTDHNRQQSGDCKNE